MWKSKPSQDPLPTDVMLTYEAAFPLRMPYYTVRVYKDVWWQHTASCCCIAFFMWPLWDRTPPVLSFFLSILLLLPTCPLARCPFCLFSSAFVWMVIHPTSQCPCAAEDFHCSLLSRPHLITWTYQPALNGLFYLVQVPSCVMRFDLWALTRELITRKGSDNWRALAFC